ncbi:type I asparaginase [Neptunomonas antarctica]|uniref:asparaginase n=1 Tax=Neptunomonas antarctica TaxID=619304 RepID=A0A1N7N504_9GAMM|nr:type I asparaginase [Neptunomonas antarctica]SIS93483.1 asparaginase [Neptunomonas antarctica]
MNKPRVLIIYTGGTIGMWPSPDGYAPQGGFSGLLEQRLNQVSISALQPFDIIELDKLIDSSNIVPDDWTTLAKLIIQNYDEYDGFVVLHGTDTMAYTASALSFILAGLTKPVILTGSQIPLAQPRTDATNNLLNAIEFAREPSNQEVCICFDSQLLRGNRAKKVHTSALRAFASPNFSSLGHSGIQVELYATSVQSLDKSDTDHHFNISDFQQPTLSHQVAQLHLYPGISDAQLDAVLDNEATRGVVMLSFGAGNPPDSNQHLMTLLDKANQRGVVIVNLTLCHSGQVIQGSYATGAKLNKLGVIPGSDMTVEAAFTKLIFLLATQTDISRVKALMATSLCGELTS